MYVPVLCARADALRFFAEPQHANEQYNDN